MIKYSKKKYSNIDSILKPKYFSMKYLSISVEFEDKIKLREDSFQRKFDAKFPLEYDMIEKR